MNILVTNFNNIQEDVMIMFDSQQYPNITIDTIIDKLKKANSTFDDIFEVEPKELQYYVYDPCYLDDTVLISLNLEAA